eukprot:5146302-Alexandrium_andersonii.AAC.1
MVSPVTHPGRSTGATTYLPLHPAETAQGSPSSQLVHADVGRNCLKCCWAGPGGSSTAGAP